MTNQEILDNLLLEDLDLRNPPDSRKDFLLNLIDVAQTEIKREGATLNLDDLNHCSIIASYAAYLYRKRNETENAMPRQLRYRLNNLIFSQKAE